MSCVGLHLYCAFLHLPATAFWGLHTTPIPNPTSTSASGDSTRDTNMCHHSPAAWNWLFLPWFLKESNHGLWTTRTDTLQTVATGSLSYASLGSSVPQDSLQEGLPGWLHMDGKPSYNRRNATVAFKKWQQRMLLSAQVEKCQRSRFFLIPSGDLGPHGHSGLCPFCEFITQYHRKICNSEVSSTDMTKKKWFHLGLPVLPGDHLTDFALSLSICQWGCAQCPCSAPTPYASSAGAADFPGCWPLQTWCVSEHIYHRLNPLVKKGINSAGWEGLLQASEDLGFVENMKYHNPIPINTRQ